MNVNLMMLHNYYAQRLYFSSQYILSILKDIQYFKEDNYGNNRNFNMGGGNGTSIWRYVSVLHLYEALIGDSLAECVGVACWDTANSTGSVIHNYCYLDGTTLVINRTKNESYCAVKMIILDITPTYFTVAVQKNAIRLNSQSSISIPDTLTELKFTNFDYPSILPSKMSYTMSYTGENGTHIRNIDGQCILKLPTSWLAAIKKLSFGAYWIYNIEL